MGEITKTQGGWPGNAYTSKKVEKRRYRRERKLPDAEQRAGAAWARFDNDKKQDVYAARMGRADKMDPDFRGEFRKDFWSRHKHSVVGKDVVERETGLFWKNRKRLKKGRSGVYVAEYHTTGFWRNDKSYYFNQDRELTSYRSDNKNGRYKSSWERTQDGKWIRTAYFNNRKRDGHFFRSTEERLSGIQEDGSRILTRKKGRMTHRYRTDADGNVVEMLSREDKRSHWRKAADGSSIDAKRSLIWGLFSKQRRLLLDANGNTIGAEITGRRRFLSKRSRGFDKNGRLKSSKHTFGWLYKSEKIYSGSTVSRKRRILFIQLGRKPRDMNDRELAERDERAAVSDRHKASWDAARNGTPVQQPLSLTGGQSQQVQQTNPVVAGPSPVQPVVGGFTRSRRALQPGSGLPPVTPVVGGNYAPQPQVLSVAPRPSPGQFVSEPPRLEPTQPVIPGQSGRGPDPLAALDAAMGGGQQGLREPVPVPAPQPTQPSVTQPPRRQPAQPVQQTNPVVAGPTPVQPVVGGFTRSRTVLQSGSGLPPVTPVVGGNYAAQPQPQVLSVAPRPSGRFVSEPPRLQPAQTVIPGQSGRGPDPLAALDAAMGGGQQGLPQPQPVPAPQPTQPSVTQPPRRQPAQPVQQTNPVVAGPGAVPPVVGGFTRSVRAPDPLAALDAAMGETAEPRPGSFGNASRSSDGPVPQPPPGTIDPNSAMPRRSGSPVLDRPPSRTPSTETITTGSSFAFSRSGTEHSDDTALTTSIPEEYVPLWERSRSASPALGTMAPRAARTAVRFGERSRDDGHSRERDGRV